MSAHKEMTRYAFISHMEDYIKKLLTDPLHADTDDFLKYHNIDGPRALSLLIKRTDPNDENSAILIKTTKIKDNGTDENGNRKKDSFVVKYKAPRKNYTKKMRNLYINLFESNIIESTILNEDGEGCPPGATSAENCNGSAPIVPFLGKTKPIKQKTLYITSEQQKYIKKILDEESVVNTQYGDFGYDAPAFAKKGDPSLDHKNMMEKSWTNGK